MRLADSLQLLAPSGSAWLWCRAYDLLGNPCQWLGPTGWLQGPGHFCPKQNSDNVQPLLWISPTEMAKTLWNALQSETLHPASSFSPLSFHKCQISMMVWRLFQLSSASSLSFLLLPPNKPLPFLPPAQHRLCRTPLTHQIELCFLLYPVNLRR